MSTFLRSVLSKLLIAVPLFLVHTPDIRAEKPPVEVLYFTPEEFQAFVRENAPAGAIPQQGDNIFNLHQILAFQLHLLNQVPATISSTEAMLFFVYTASVAYYITIGAERQGVGFTFVAQNLFLAAAAINTIVAIRFSLLELGITNGNPWPFSTLMRLYFHLGNLPTPSPPPQFQQFDLPVFPPMMMPATSIAILQILPSR